MMETCPICNTQSKTYLQEGSLYHVECPKCGHYYIDTKTSLEIKSFLDKQDYYKLSSWIKEQNIENYSNKIPLIDEDRFQKILKMKNKRIIEKFDRMILYLSKYKQNSTINKEIIVRCWMKDKNEFEILYKKAISKGYIESDEKIVKSHKMPLFTNFTYDGLEYLESIELDPNKHLDGIFVAYNFTDEMHKIFETNVKDVIEELGFKYVKVDQNTTKHDEKITDEIISKLKSARTIIADFTNNSTNVYFEAGYAMGLKIPVVWTCKDGHQFSFDTAQFPHIIWKDGKDLGRKVKERLEAIL